jgi:hypothetical protein
VIGGVNINDPQVSDIVNETTQLATVINGRSIDTPYIQNYLRTYKNFSNIKYEKIPFNSTTKLRLTVGAKEDNIKGFEIGSKRYAIHLIFCDHITKTCAFRINGVATGALAAINNLKANITSKFDLDENYALQIENIQFYYCDNRRFCNVHYEAYDIVNISVMPR